MNWNNEGELSANVGDRHEYPREYHALGDHALVSTRPDDASLPPLQRFQSLRELAQRLAGEPPLPLRALIFHCSRCGSTLLARLFAMEGSSRVFAEPEVLGKFLWRRAARIAGGAAHEETSAFIRAFGLGPDATERGLVIKLPSWAVRFVAPLRACFPAVPFIYLLREPVEVVRSIAAYQPVFLQDRNRAAIAAAFGRPPDEVQGLPPTEWYAWYVDRNLRQALRDAAEFSFVIDHARISTGYLQCVNQVTGAHLSVASPDVAALLARHAKAPRQNYAPPAATIDELHAKVEAIAGEAYRQWRVRARG